MALTVLYVNPMEGETNPAVDAIAYGVQHSLTEAGIDMRTLFADFRSPEWLPSTVKAIEAGMAAGVDAIALYALDPAGPGDAVAKARANGIPVFTLVRPHYEVNGSVVYPNFNHGVLMVDYLATIVDPGVGVCVIGGPDTVDDAEEVAGLVFGLKRRGLNLMNDPFDRHYCNVTDVASGGTEVTRRILQEFPKIDALIPYNDETMRGALVALEEAGRLEEMKIISRNGSSEGVEAVRAGKTAGTWDLDASGIGTTLGDMIVQHLTREPVPDGFLVTSPVGRMITRENIDTWRPWDKRINTDPFRVGLD